MTDMADMADIAFYLMTAFYGVLALATVVILCRLPGLLRYFDAQIAKMK